MMKSLRVLLAVALLGISSLAFGDSITNSAEFSRGALGIWQNSAVAQELDFTFNGGMITHFNVLVGTHAGSTVTYWLTNSLGAGTTAANVLTSQTITYGSAFTGWQDIQVNHTSAAGPLYIILSTNTSGAAWYYGTPTVGTVGSTDQLSINSYYNASFAPAGTFYRYGNPVAFHLWDDPAPVAPTAVPEPASFVLLGSGFAGLAGILRRRRKAA